MFLSAASLVSCDLWGEFGAGGRGSKEARVGLPSKLTGHPQLSALPTDEHVDEVAGSGQLLQPPEL